MTEAKGTKNLSDLSGLSESEVLSIPEENLPASLLPEFLQRREEALQKKQTDDASDYDARLISQSRAKDQSRTNDQQRSEMEAEAYQAEMRDIYGRENALLADLNVEEVQDKKRLADIDSRALKLSDGRLAYVGANGTYVDRQGQLLQGKDDTEARAQNQLHPDAATWSERSAAKQQLDDTMRMRQDVLAMEAQQKKEDAGNLSGDQMASSLRDRGATISRYETEFAERSEARQSSMSVTEKTITNATYGGDDYMAAYSKPGDSLMSTFVKAADPSAASGSNPNAQSHTQNVPTPAFTR